MTKKYMKIVLALAVFGLLALSSTSFATVLQHASTAVAGETLEANSTVTGEELSLDFSPKVMAMYGDDGVTGAVQWYVIATYHIGGTKTYATAQNITSIYKADDTLDFTDVILTEASVEAWSGDVWSR
ncbi:MAG TPA: hypothetical protein VGA63_11235 [Geopsychrobacteraceae bacterium]|jgi:hypothetical protein